MKPYAILMMMAMLGAAVSVAYSADTPPAAANSEVYGWQLMTPEERAAYHDRMRSLRTLEERQRFRDEHHQQMARRAKERGVTLPEMPRGPGMSGGRGPGAGSGPGPGTGPGPDGGPRRY